MELSCVLNVGAIADKSSHYVWPSGSGKDDSGHIQVRWSLQDEDNKDGDREKKSRGEKPVVRQYNVSWTADGTTREMFLEPHITKCSIPADKRRFILHILNYIAQHNSFSYSFIVYHLQLFHILFKLLSIIDISIYAYIFTKDKIYNVRSL